MTHCVLTVIGSQISENKVVSEYFSSYIEKQELPLKADGQAFLKSQPLHLFQGRKAHDIYDKVRNLIGRKN